MTTPSSSAALMVTSLKVEPGSYMSVTARLRLSIGTSRREAVGVEARRDGHGQDVSGVRIHDDRSRRLGAETLHRRLDDVLGIRLHLVVDRQPDALARRRRLRGDDIECPPERILHDRLAPRMPCEHGIERLLETLKPVVVRAREPEHLGGDPVLRVGAKLLRVEAEARAGPASRASQPSRDCPCGRGRRSRATCP